MLRSCAHEALPPTDAERALPILTRRLRSASSLLLWYGLAVGLSALALLLMVLSWPLMEPSVFFLFFAAATVSAIYGGIGPGLTATVLSALAINYFFLKPYDQLLGRPQDALRLVVFLSTGVMVSWLAAGRKRAEERLRDRTGYLERWATQRK